jgi:hypothetical protein
MSTYTCQAEEQLIERLSSPDMPIGDGILHCPYAERCSLAEGLRDACGYVQDTYSGS